MAAYNSTLDIDGKQASPHVEQADPPTTRAPPESGLTDTDISRKPADPELTDNWRQDPPT
jgi:hypothetical protein